MYPQPFPSPVGSLLALHYLGNYLILGNISYEFPPCFYGVNAVDIGAFEFAFPIHCT